MNRGSLLWILAMLSAPPLLADTLSIRADDWFPVNGKPGSRQEGVYIDLVRDIVEAAGHTLDYRLMSWDAAVAAVKAGDYDCVVGATPSDAPGFVYTAQPWMRFDNVFYALADRQLAVAGVDSLEQHVVGVIEGYSYGDALDAYVAAHKADPARVQLTTIGRNPLETLVNRLVTGKVDVVVESEVVMQSHLSKTRLGGRIVQVGSMQDRQPIYIACSPAKPASRTWVALLDAGFQRHLRDGTLDAFYSKYGLSSVPLLAP